MSAPLALTSGSYKTTAWLPHSFNRKWTSVSNLRLQTSWPLTKDTGDNDHQLIVRTVQRQVLAEALRVRQGKACKFHPKLHPAKIWKSVTEYGTLSGQCLTLIQIRKKCLNCVCQCALFNSSQHEGSTTGSVAWKVSRSWANKGD